MNVKRPVNEGVEGVSEGEGGEKGGRERRELTSFLEEGHHVVDLGLGGSVGGFIKNKRTNPLELISCLD